MDATFHLEKAVFNYRVAAVIIENGHVLLHRQVHDKHWALPGGRVKVLEDSQTAIKRELVEELGIESNSERLLWITENFFTYAGKPFHEIGFYYHINSSNEEVEFRTEIFNGFEGEHLQYKWMPIRELHTIKLYPQFLTTELNELPATPKHIICSTYQI
ncbi:NUDIX hydrolase [Metabacillus malikii]|uniref:8-oxo-dGTP pyrophosphatase MutT (NUDIX family) n=1 Tax=Metabacillus malikii TaxID=1504265 RepID=A0ABT9Z9N5_9BACI|nr:NUDIX hydrolase [Metabacillus malikii]MDQ0228969.1 8-oxo-dGTP pyrophosphatase MutT (NUDIX family) [Metabacillus malikii]